MNLTTVVPNRIWPGYLTSEVYFYPVDQWSQVGYWYQNNFYNTECGYDFSRTSEAYPVIWVHWNSYLGYLPSGSVPGYGLYYQTDFESVCTSWIFYRTYREAKQYLDTLVTIRSPNTGLAISRVVRRVRRTCTLCNNETEEQCQLLGRTCCLPCIKAKYIKGEMFFGWGYYLIYWTPKMIVEVHKVLRNRLSDEEKTDFPQEIRIPSDCMVCIGRDDPVQPGYPPRGHIVGMCNIALEDSCPNTEHVLCNSCAAKTLYCPECGEFILYEGLPIDNPYCREPMWFGPHKDTCSICNTFWQQIKKCHIREEGEKVARKAIGARAFKERKKLLFLYDHRISVFRLVPFVLVREICCFVG